MCSICLLSIGDYKFLNKSLQTMPSTNVCFGTTCNKKYKSNSNEGWVRGGGGGGGGGGLGEV